jgi:hypothetical protein
LLEALWISREFSIVSTDCNSVVQWTFVAAGRRLVTLCLRTGHFINYEALADTDTNNAYKVQVHATDKKRNFTMRYRRNDQQ